MRPGTTAATFQRTSLSKTTPGAFFLAACDGKFTDEDLNDEGNAFTQVYFDLEKGSFIKDYERILGTGLPSLYHVEDSWANFDAVRPILDKRFKDWRRAQSSGTRPWWKFWPS